MLRTTSTAGCSLMTLVTLRLLEAAAAVGVVHGAVFQHIVRQHPAHIWETIDVRLIEQFRHAGWFGSADTGIHATGLPS